MSFNRTKAHAIDLLFLDAAARKYPQHSITVVNKWRVAVCGVHPPDAIGKLYLVENGERNWELQQVATP